MTDLHAPFPWIGGKYYSARQIVSAFPLPQQYSTYVEVFGGAAHVLFRKPPFKHLEVYNDRNADLVNFWMMCHDHPAELQQQIDNLPYARSLYDAWQDSLFDQTPLSEMERAVRWFYVLRSSLGGVIRKSRGNWGYQVQSNQTPLAQSLHNAAQLFPALSQRFRAVQIECQPFEKIITTYGRSSALLYCDPPYIDAEFYYEEIFTLDDHKRLAALLNHTSAHVALSYAPHPVLEEWYPPARWRRITWQTYKHAEKTRTARQEATEMLLLNYPEPQVSLWSLAPQEEVEDLRDLAPFSGGDRDPRP